MDFEVNRTDLHQTCVIAPTEVELGEGEIRLRVDRFALTTNNITYAVFGEAMQYWNFFPASSEGWGRVPVWGFADVVESRCESVTVGARVYGYLPMSTDLVVVPGKMNDRGFIDTVEHRRPMATAYNNYVLVDADPIYTPDHEDHQMLLWPLFFTSFLIDDVIADAGFYGATSVVLSSASSKTAIVAAYLLHRRGDLEVVGLTSADNLAFVEGLGCYSRVVTYDQIDSLPVESAVFVDMAGNSVVRNAVHAHYGSSLRYSMMVGGTHWDQPAAPASADALVGPTPQFFFAPTQITKRNAEWGNAVLDERVGNAWEHFVSWASEWLQFHFAIGPVAVEAAYQELLAGGADPSVGYICSL